MMQDGGAHSAFVHRGRQNQQKNKKKRNILAADLTSHCLEDGKKIIAQ